MRLLLAFAVTLGLLACSQRPGADVLRPAVPASEAQGARIVRVHAMTTRAPDPGLPWAYGADRASEPHYALFDISIPPGHRSGQIEWPDNAQAIDPATDFMTPSQQRMDRAAFLSQVRRGPVGVYVHGFNTSFQEALYRLAQLAADAHMQGTAVLFAWPSQAHVAAYLADRDGSDYSRDALATLFSDLAAGRRADQPAMVLAHSMGARLTMEALRQLRIMGRGDVLDRLEVTLAAPDIDMDIFREQISAIGRLRHPITVLVSSDDPALKVSARLAASRTRLGQVDVRDPAVQALAVRAGIRIVDITALPTDDPAHSRYVGLLSGTGRELPQTPLAGLRHVGAFIFDQVGDTFHGLGTVLVD